MRFSADWLDMLRARVTLSELIGRDVKLIKSGDEYKALCPFHKEQTASFTVTDAKGFFHCFSCGAHGDAIEWLTEKKGLPFVEAVKHLADYAGIALPLADDPAATAREVRREQHFEVMAAAASWFATQLASAHGAAARRYIAGRGILPETARDFALGFAPLSRDALLTALGRFGITALCDAGLVICVEGKPVYDRFRGRLMIPIRDGRGRIPLGTPEARAGLRQRLTAHVKTITDPDVRTEYAAEFRKRFDVMFDRPSKPPLSGVQAKPDTFAIGLSSIIKI